MGSFHSALDDLSNFKIQQKSLLLQQETAFKKNITNMEASAAQVSHSTTNLSSTATTYHDALLNAAKTAPTGSPMVDPQVTQRVLTQTKQVLIDTGTPIANDHSLSSLREAAQEAITRLAPPPSLLVTIDDLTRIRNGGILIQLNSKEAADWVRSDTVRTVFAESLAPTATIKD
jgi:hypothetical protein